MIEYMIIIVLITILFLKFIQNLTLKRDEPIWDWPIIGMLPGVFHNASNIHDYVTQLLKHYGGTFHFKGPWYTNTNYILTSDPLNVHHILSKNNANFIKGSDFNDIFEIIGGGIFNSDYNEWKQQRKLLHSLFSRKSFETFLQQTIQTKLQNCLLPFLNHHASKERSQVDMHDIFERFMFDTTCTVLFGFDPKSLPYHQYTQLSEIAYVKALSELEIVVMYRHITPKWLWKLLNKLQIGVEKKYNIAKENLEHFLQQSIKYSKHEVEKRCSKTEEWEEESQFSIIEMLTMEGTEKGEETDVKFLRDTAVNRLFAGSNTTSTGLTWFFWLVSTHPVVEAKIIQEMTDNNCLSKEGNLETSSVKMLDKLVYLHGAICEALRLYPPVPIEHKCAIKSDILPSGHHVSPNTKILYVLYSMGRMEKIWGEDYMEFKPERWISESGRVIHVPYYKFIAFNGGPRSCLGKDISFIQMKMVAIAISSKFHIEVVEGHPITPMFSIILNMKHRLKVNVVERCIN